MPISEQSERDYAPSEGMPPRPRLLTLYKTGSRSHDSRFSSASAVLHYFNLLVHWLLLLLVGGLAFACLWNSGFGIWMGLDRGNNGGSSTTSDSNMHKEMLLIPVMVLCAYWNWLSKELVRYKH
eukprot:g10634.t1